MREPTSRKVEAHMAMTVAVRSALCRDMVMVAMRARGATIQQIATLEAVTRNYASQRLQQFEHRCCKMGLPSAPVFGLTPFTIRSNASRWMDEAQLHVADERLATWAEGR